MVDLPQLVEAFVQKINSHRREPEAVAEIPEAARRVSRIGYTDAKGSLDRRGVPSQAKPRGRLAEDSLTWCWSPCDEPPRSSPLQVLARRATAGFCFRLDAALRVRAGARRTDADYLEPFASSTGLPWGVRR